MLAAGQVQAQVNADGSNPVNLTNNPADDRSPTWSPDGRRIAFVSDRDGNHEIYVMNADGTGQTRLTDTPYYDSDPALVALTPAFYLVPTVSVGACFQELRACPSEPYLVPTVSVEKPLPAPRAQRPLFRAAPTEGTAVQCGVVCRSAAVPSGASHADPLQRTGPVFSAAQCAAAPAKWTDRCKVQR